MRHYEQFVPAPLGNLLTDGTHASIQKRYASLKEAANNSTFGEFDNDVVVLDTETTGLSFYKDDLIQIAAARVHGGKITDWFVTFVNPQRRIPEDTTRLTGISQQDVEDAPTPGKALTQLVEFVGTSYVVAHNANFDKEFTTKHVEGYPLLENTWIDTLDLARIALPRANSHRLIDLAVAFDCPVSTHRADADVEATCSVLRVLLAAVQAMPDELIVKISQLATREDWPTVAVFQYFANQILEERCGAAEESDGETERSGAEAQEADATKETKEKNKTKRLDPQLLRRLVLENVCVKEEVNSDVDNPTAQNPYYSRIDAQKLHNDAAYKFIYPSAQEIENEFSQDGCVGVLYKNYEQRPEQVQMSQAIAAAIENGENLAVEAGTGVGKSMAYLVPLIKFAKANNITVGVATKTNTLLDQLVFNELPALNSSMGGVKYASLKGQANYICLRKAMNKIEYGAKNKEIGIEKKNTAPAIATLASFIEQTEFDDVATLKIDYKLLNKVEYTTTSSECLKQKCPFYKQGCFVFGARRAASDVDVVITNHSMLFSDIRTDGNLLPPIRYWAIDEAHRTEEEARSAFSYTASSYNISALRNHFLSEDARINPLMRAGNVMSGVEDEKIPQYFAMLSKAKKQSEEYVQAAQTYIEEVKNLLATDKEAASKPYEITEIWVNKHVKNSEEYAHIKAAALELLYCVRAVMRTCQDIASFMEDYAKENKQVKNAQGRISSVVFQCSDIVQALEVNFGCAQANENENENASSSEGSAAASAAISTAGTFGASGTNAAAAQTGAAELDACNNPASSMVFAANIYKTKEKFADEMVASPINIGDVLNETLFENTYSVIFTSATLTTEKNFNSFTNALGLNTCKNSKTRYLMLNSSYDFNKNMKIYVPTDMPEPQSPQYMQALQNLLIGVHIAQGGSVLSLFTNRRDMEQCYDVLRAALKSENLRVLCQKQGLSTKGIKDEFIKDKSVSLLALKSFWEGFDAPGDTLKSVIVSRLPFSKPNDPLMCERRERDARAWAKYALPASIIEVKQAVGRLIRKADDKGSVILADHRIISKNYGKAFVNSLPSENVAYLTIEEIAEDIKKNMQ